MNTLTSANAHMRYTVSFSQCPVCDSQMLQPIPAPERWIGEGVFNRYRGSIHLTQCRQCSYLFGNPRLRQDILDLFYQGNTYSCHRHASNDTVQKRKAQYILAFLEQGVSRRGHRKLLDFGCGGGTFLKYARDAGWDARGFDPGRQAVLSCEERGLPVSDRFEDLPNQTFDIITLNHVFEHVADVHETLQSLKNLLSPGGKIFIEVPNVRSLRAILSNSAFIRWFRFDERYRAFPIHLSYLSKKSMRALLERNRFHIDVLSTYGIGLEELFYEEEVDPGSDTGTAAQPGESHVTVRERSSGSLKRILKKLYYRAGLGENLMVLARPA